jgi:hypothetical protein
MCYRKLQLCHPNIIKLIPYFDKCIHITNDESDNSLIVEVTHYKKKDNRIIRLQQSDLEIIHQK